MPRAVQAEESIEHSNEGKSGRQPQRQSLKQRAVLEALFVLPFSPPKSYSYPGTPLSLRTGVVNMPRGRSAYSRSLSARIRAECHDRQLSSTMSREECLAHKAQS